MDNRVITRREVEEKLANSGDYVKMDLLQKYLRMNIDFDTKRFVMLKLSEVYEKRQMYLESARLIKNVAEINTTYEGKYNDFSKSMELFIKGGDYEEAELTLKKALACSNAKQKDVVKNKMKAALDIKGDELTRKDKRRHAVAAYEKLISLPFLTENERSNSQNKLMKLYEKLGMISDFYGMKKAIENPQPIKESREYKEEKKDDFDINDLLR